jgi:hypothetical protein
MTTLTVPLAFGLNPSIGVVAEKAVENAPRELSSARPAKSMPDERVLGVDINAMKVMLLTGKTNKCNAGKRRPTGGDF